MRGLTGLFILWLLLTPAAAPPFRCPPSLRQGEVLIPPPASYRSAGGDDPVYHTSDYLSGQVAVGLLLPACRPPGGSLGGSFAPCRETWTEAELAQVRAAFTEATAWWAEREPRAKLDFTLAVKQVPISLEPITYPAAESCLWVNATMAALGYDNPGCFATVRRYAHDLRVQTGADWAIIAFVVDSEADPDGLFADGRFAYAFIGGPALIVTTDNGGYGIDAMPAIAAHEIGHLFGALDQYPGSYPCEVTSGYFQVENGNSLAGGDCATNQPSLMRGDLSGYQAGALDSFARGQVGWRDIDRDAVLDLFDCDYTAAPDCRQGYRGYLPLVALNPPF